MSKQFEADYNSKDVGEAIQYIRENVAQLDIEKFAKHCKMNPETLKQIEDGKTSHGFKSLQNVAALFDIKLTITIDMP